MELTVVVAIVFGSIMALIALLTLIVNIINVVLNARK